MWGGGKGWGGGAADGWAAGGWGGKAAGGKGWGSAKGAAPAASGPIVPESTLEGLIEQIKNIQRTDPASKEQWIAYVGPGGKRDPSMHPPEFLQEFIQFLNSGERLPVGPHGSAPSDVDFVAAVKTLQKRAPQTKACWAQFCMMAGGGKRDPSQHDANFFIQFFEMMAQTAAAGGSFGGPMGMMGMGMGMGMGGPAKRMRTGPLIPGMSTEKDILVARLKNFQKVSQEGKDLWGTYADTYLNGNRDPNRHTEETLREFIVNHGVPEIDASSMGGGGMGGGGWGGMPMEPMDPEKEALVQRVKVYQKSGPEAKQAWWEFIGPTKDPARAPAEKLMEFCNTYGVP